MDEVCTKHLSLRLVSDPSGTYLASLVAVAAAETVTVVGALLGDEGGTSRGRDGRVKRLRGEGGRGALVEVWSASVLEEGREWVLDLGLRGSDSRPRVDIGGSAVGLRVRLAWVGRQGSRGRTADCEGVSETPGWRFLICLLRLPAWLAW